MRQCACRLCHPWLRIAALIGPWHATCISLVPVSSEHPPSPRLVKRVFYRCLHCTGCCSCCPLQSKAAAILTGPLLSTCDLLFCTICARVVGQYAACLTLMAVVSLGQSDGIPDAHLAGNMYLLVLLAMRRKTCHGSVQLKLVTSTSTKVCLVWKVDELMLMPVIQVLPFLRTGAPKVTLLLQSKCPIQASD